VDLDLIDEFEKHKTDSGLDFVQRKVVRLGETMRHYLRWNDSDLNRFVELTRKLDVNFDRKRRWERKFTSCGDALESVIDSRPLSF